jgi:uncharacterized protein YciI
MTGHSPPRPSPPEELADLIYELLDAHSDTIELIDHDEAASARDLRWPAHLDYLRALQRKGRELLAHGAAPGATRPEAGDEIRAQRRR